MTLDGATVAAGAVVDQAPRTSSAADRDGGSPAASATGTCWHCAEPLPRGEPICATVRGVVRPVCCHGCRAACEWIEALGLSDYYRLRSHASSRPPDPARIARDAALFAHPGLAGQVMRDLGANRCEAVVAVEGLRCAACSWLIERAASALPGVAEIEVNVAARRARIVWDGTKVTLPSIANTLMRAGYRVLPLDARTLDDARREESRTAMKRLAVAGFGAMQAMMYAAALYFGAADRMDAATRDLFRWLGLLVATPVVFYSAKPFFAGARRSLAARRLGVDVPVALAIALVYSASFVEAVTGGRDVYFDSVSMFVFLLLAGRYLEMRARHRAGELADGLARRSPVVAERIEDDGSHTAVAAFELASGDRVHVAEGAIVPADGAAEGGEVTVDEALLTGESTAVRKRDGDVLLAGSVVIDGPVRMRVMRSGVHTRFSGIAMLAARAATARPRLAREGERAAARFVARVLVLAAITAAAWVTVDPARAFAAVLAVLVVACPCAFALAVPAALTRALGVLAASGILVVKPDAIEPLARATEVVLDKTGTLTEPGLALDAIEAREGTDPLTALALARALARGSTHPLARAIVSCADANLDAAPQRHGNGNPADGREDAPVSKSPAGESLHVEPGAGITGVVDGARLRLGRAAWALRGAEDGAGDGGGPDRCGPSPPDALVLADEKGVVASFGMTDRLRPGARAAIDALRRCSVRVSIASGDSPARVAAIASELAIESWQAGLSPRAKLDALERLRTEHAQVIAVGDGINDAPLLAGADVGVAIGSGADLARASGDIVLVGSRIDALVTARSVARETLAILAQNRRWALAWNFAAIPLAALGFVPPWLAAAGMSASSLFVVLNALRIGRATRGAPAA